MRIELKEPDLKRLSDILGDIPFKYAVRVFTFIDTLPRVADAATPQTDKPADTDARPDVTLQ